VLKYRHQVGIRSIHADIDGSRLAFIDDQFAGYVYIAASQEVVPIKPLKRKCEGVLWDQTAASSFVAYDEKTCTTYSLVRHSVYGKQVKEVGDTEILSDQQPIMLYDGDLCLHGSTGKLASTTLSTHKNDPTASFDQQLALLIALQKFDVAFELCRQELNGEKAWKTLGEAAISNLNIDFGEGFSNK
jgi:WD repeat-containing protein 19